MSTKRWLLMFMLLGWPHFAIAADFTLGGNAEMECYATLSGVIARGDTERVALALDQSNTGPVCLDSPGGLWAEGISLMELFYERAIPTAIAAGARCESACAVAFLGGSTRALNVVPFRARFLHVNGHLGFHAPYVEVPPGQYDQATVLAAFAKAMEVVTELTAWSERLALPDAFLVRMFGTPYDDMDMIDTVGKASELSVQLVGHSLPQELTDPMIRQACKDAWPFLTAETDRYDSGAGITTVLRIGPNQNGMQRGVAVAEYGVESWTGWFVCAVGYNPPQGPVPVRWYDLARFDGARDILYVQVSNEAIQEWSDPMNAAPDPSLAVIVQAAEPLSDMFADNNTIRAETVFATDVPIRQMQSVDWNRDLPAPLMRKDGQLAASSNPSSNRLIVEYSSFWDHNGSRMGMVVDGTRRQFHYVVPRSALAKRGVTPGALLFDGVRVGNRYEGEARIFATPNCGVFTYRVAGPVGADQRSVTMFGRAPRVSKSCEITGYRDDTLVFSLE